eukprot:2393802-Lingulodinium_polyedra.AAC.1
MRLRRIRPLARATPGTVIATVPPQTFRNTWSARVLPNANGMTPGATFAKQRPPGGKRRLCPRTADCPD